MALRLIVLAAVVSALKKKKKDAFVVTVASEVYVVLKTSIRDGSLVPIGEDVRKL